jgi:Ca-activated chloride channel family protein
VCALGAQQVPAQQGATFRSGQRTVAVYTTVTEANGHLVINLSQDDFEVYDDGKLQTLSLFANEVQPITLVSMLDVSGSMSGNIPLLRRAGAQLAAHLSKDDKARFGEFGDHVNVITPAFTNDVNELIRSLWLELEPGGATPLWNAVDVAMSALADQTGRRVVLVFTDGYDTSSARTTLSSVVKRAQEEDFMIYAVGLRSSSGMSISGPRPRGGFGSGVFAGDPDPGLKTLAEESGGGYMPLQAATELDAAFTRVVEELRHQYILGFVPAALDGKLHRIDVRVKKPGLTARARKSYLAAPEKTGSSDKQREHDRR